MNSKGDDPLENTTISSVILVITLVLAGIIALKFTTFSAQCPAGFDEVKESDSKFDRYCGTVEYLKENNLECCRRKTDLNQICLWDTEKKTPVGECKDINTFDSLKECQRLCNEARDKFIPTSELYKSDFCNNNIKFPVTSADGKSIMKTCYEIYPSCGSCQPSGGIPQE
ncbi:hypothetical protein HYT56_00775 [Candidatus Woesearchaeota archaeon]|nr:hypothetical protein [Candidatus Woesearchaeota archaeon]